MFIAMLISFIRVVALVNGMLGRRARPYRVVDPANLQTILGWDLLSVAWVMV